MAFFNLNKRKLSRDFFVAHSPVFKASQAVSAELSVIVEGADNDLPLQGVALFAQDNVRTDDAAVLAVVDKKNSDPEHRKFVSKKIRDRRISMLNTAAGKAMIDRSEGLSRSKMNDNHIVFNFPMHAGLKTRTLLQFAFDRVSYEAAPVSNVRVKLSPILKAACDNLHGAVEDVWKSMPEDHSISDALLLNVPATPNVFLMHWDVVNSTSFAKADYPIFRQYLNELKKDFNDIIKSHGGELLRSEGDGQWFTFDTKKAPLKADLRKMALTGVIEAARALIQTHQNHLASSGFTKPYLRCTVGIGYLEQSADEKTGPLFWDVAETSKSASLHKNSILMTPDLRDFLYPDRARQCFKSNEISLKPL